MKMYGFIRRLRLVSDFNLIQTESSLALIDKPPSKYTFVAKASGKDLHMYIV